MANDVDEAVSRLTAWARDYGATSRVFADDVLVLLAEVRKLRGVITQHDLCHDLHGRVGAEDFARGCAAEQRRLYGCAPDADEVERLKADAERLRETNRSFHRRLQQAESRQNAEMLRPLFDRLREYESSRRFAREWYEAHGLDWVFGCSEVQRAKVALLLEEKAAAEAEVQRLRAALRSIADMWPGDDSDNVNWVGVATAMSGRAEETLGEG